VPEELVDLLVVDDNRDDLALALHALRKNGFTQRVHTVRDGVEALEFLFRTGRYAGRAVSADPKLVLLDLKLPLLDGIEVLRQIKGDARTKSIPVVAMTASREERDVLESYRLGVNSYVVKPVDFDEFTAVIRMLGEYWLVLNTPPEPQG
jgi:two-component system response regulator